MTSANTELMGPRMSGDELAAMIQKIVINGDLGALSPSQRMDYYWRVCDSLGIDGKMRPFEFIPMKGEDGKYRLVMYATKACTDMLRAKHGVSVEDVRVTVEREHVTATAIVRDRSGRTDADIGVVATSYYHFKKRQQIKLEGESLANARMKAVTKAKRRATLSLCGLGMLDEVEVADVMDAETDEDAEAREVAIEITGTAEVVDAPAATASEPVDDAEPEFTAGVDRMTQWVDVFTVRYTCPADVARRVLVNWLGANGYVVDDVNGDNGRDIIANAKATMADADWRARIAREVDE